MNISAIWKCFFLYSGYCFLCYEHQFAQIYFYFSVITFVYFFYIRNEDVHWNEKGQNLGEVSLSPFAKEVIKNLPILNLSRIGCGYLWRIDTSCCAENRYQKRSNTNVQIYMRYVGDVWFRDSQAICLKLSMGEWSISTYPNGTALSEIIFS